MRKILAAILAFAMLLPLARGQGSFDPPVTTGFSVLGQTIDVAAGDVDNDCFPDLILVDWTLNYGHFISLMNDGSGAYPTAQWEASELHPVAIEFLDLDGDGWQDLVSTTDNGAIVVFPNLGGTLDLINPMWGIVPQGVPYLDHLETADLDGDGDLDLVVGEGFGGTPQLTFGWYVLLNTGAGGFAAAPTVPLANLIDVIGRPGDMKLEDLNGDGLPEIVVFDASNDTVFFHENLGGGSFGPPQTIFTPAGGQTPYGIALGRFDAGPTPDLFVSLGNLVSVSTNDGTGTFTLSGVLFHPPATGIEGLLADDFDRDGDLDIVHHSNVFMASDPVGFMARAGWWTFTPETIAPSGMTGRKVDVDLDGYMDVVVCPPAGLTVCRNATGGGSYAGGIGGLATSVDGGPFDGSPKTFGPGPATLTFGTDPSFRPCLAGNPATILVNLPPESAQTAVTSLGPSGPFPGLEVVTPFSTPPGTAYLAGDGLGFGVPGFVDLGLPPVSMGDPPVSIPLPAGLVPPGSVIRLQALYHHPIPAHFLTFGIVATNAVTLTAN